MEPAEEYTEVFDYEKPVFRNKSYKGVEVKDNPLSTNKGRAPCLTAKIVVISNSPRSNPKVKPIVGKSSSIVNPNQNLKPTAYKPFLRTNT